MKEWLSEAITDVFWVAVEATLIFLSRQHVFIIARVVHHRELGEV